MELKELYNKDPGPGTYNEKVKTVELDAKTQQKRLVGLHGQACDKDFTSK